MATNSVIEHRANYYFVKLHEEYLALCGGNHCQALILSVLEEWTNTKKEKKQSLYIYMTYPQWITALYGAYGRNAIIKALAELEEKRIIKKRPYRLHGKDTFEYLLNIGVVNAFLKELPEKKPEDILPNINAFKKGRVPKSTGLEQDGSSPNAVLNGKGNAFKKGRNVESITQNQRNTESEVAAIDTLQIIDAELSMAADTAGIFSPLKNLPEEEQDKWMNSVKFVHSDHNFLAFDDEWPTTMMIYLTSKRQESELEDDRRLRVAQELQQELKDRGINLEVHVTRESDEDSTVEAEAHQELEEPSEILQKPAANAPRTAEMVIALVEFLRGGRYSSEVRKRELHAAKKLLNFQPTYSLTEIEEAWCHGSDDYWREKHDDQDVHVHDLVNTDSHGRYRIEAFLEHKRTQERRTTVSYARRQQQASVPMPAALSVPRQVQLTMTEIEAHELVKQIEQNSATGGYQLSGSVQQEGSGWVVRVSWLSVAWKGDLGLELRSATQWQHEYAEWQEMIELRSAKRKGA